MCCQITPAIGIEPMKPMTTMRLRFISSHSHSSWLEFSNNNGGIAGDDRVWRNAFRDDRARSNDRVFADGYAFQNYRIHADPDIVGNSDWCGLQLWSRRTIFEKWRERLRVDMALGRLERMKIGIGDADVPRDETVRPNADLFLRHDERAIQQSEITDCAAPILTNRKRAAGVTGNVLTDHDRLSLTAAEMTKNLCGLAIKSFAKLHVRGNRMRPPIVFNTSILSDVAHE